MAKPKQPDISELKPHPLALLPGPICYGHAEEAAAGLPAPTGVNFYVLHPGRLNRSRRAAARIAFQSSQ